MSKVFVVQKQQRWDAARGMMVPKFDVEPARQYGELVFLLSPTAAPWNPDSIIGELRGKLIDFTSEDFLLLIGNPVIIGWTVTLAYQRTGGWLNLLQWSGKDGSYRCIPCNLGGAPN